jgi:molybdopterin/thiamine biosynthesis adenylyltransferase/rhodanese-related sulfurtransferase
VTDRYARHLVLPEIGPAGQEKLRRASVLVVGAGGLGSPVLLYLAAAGVGRLGVVDFDRVDESNLHRQVLYGTSDVGRPKLEAARDRLRDLNPEVEVVLHETQLTSSNALEILGGYDIVIDGTDNFPTRYLVADACVLLGKPNIYGSIFRFEGQVSVFDARTGPCYRCFHPEPPPPHLVPSCAEGGVLGVLPGVIGTLQATEAIKLITGAGEPLVGRLLLFDALAMTFRTLRLPKRCHEHAPITKLIDYEEFCNPVLDQDITPAQLSEKLAAGEEVVCIDVREPYEWNAGHLEQAQHIPLNELPKHIQSLPRDKEIVMICRSGGRSAHAQQHLKAAGFSRVRNLVGGMSRYSHEVDPSIKVV